jgi:hypothetical protein
MEDGEMIKPVAFDLDGTIGETLPLCIKSFLFHVVNTVSETESKSNDTSSNIRFFVPEDVNFS